MGFTDVNIFKQRTKLIWLRNNFLGKYLFITSLPFRSNSLVNIYTAFMFLSASKLIHGKVSLSALPNILLPVFFFVYLRLNPPGRKTKWPSPLIKKSFLVRVLSIRESWLDYNMSEGAREIYLACKKSTKLQHPMTIYRHPVANFGADSLSLPSLFLPSLSRESMCQFDREPSKRVLLHFQVCFFAEQ